MERAARGGAAVSRSRCRSGPVYGSAATPEMAPGRSRLRARHRGDQRTAQGLSRDARANKPLHARFRHLSRDITTGSSGSNGREICIDRWPYPAPLRSREGLRAYLKGPRAGGTDLRPLWCGCISFQGPGTRATAAVVLQRGFLRACGTTVHSEHLFLPWLWKSHVPDPSGYSEPHAKALS